MNVIDSVQPRAFTPMLVMGVDLSRNPMIGVYPGAFDGLEDVLEVCTNSLSSCHSQVESGLSPDYNMLGQINNNIPS